MERNIFDDSSESSIQTWINWFCSLPGNHFYLEVPEEFIDDEFNLTGLSSLVPYYSQALQVILDIESCEEILIENNSKPLDSKIIEPYAIMLYGLIHQRYLLTRDGLKLMAERYTHNEFGTCPRHYCYDTPVLPMGRFDEIGKESLHLYCPVCLDIYNPPIHQPIDGAHFGTTFTNLLFLTFPELIPTKYEIYQPRIFGFRVNPGPKNQWLRLRPQENNEQKSLHDLSCKTENLHMNDKFL